MNSVPVKASSTGIVLAKAIAKTAFGAQTLTEHVRLTINYLATEIIAHSRPFHLLMACS